MGFPLGHLLHFEVNISSSVKTACSPPSRPQPIIPLVSATSHKAQHITVLALAVSSALAAFLLFLTYYLLLLRLRSHFRRRSPSHTPPPTTTTTTPLNAEEEEEVVPVHEGPDHDDNNNDSFHHVWYIRTVGLDDATIASIAACGYKGGKGLVDGTDCSVCLSEFEEGELVKLLPNCNHAFHVSCIDTWLRAHVNCPLCRSPVVSPYHPQQEEEEEAPAGSSFVGGDPAVPAPIEVGVAQNGIGSFSNLGSSSSSSSSLSPSSSSSSSCSSGVLGGVVESGIVGQTDPVGSETGEEHWVTIDLNDDDHGNDGALQQHMRRSVSTDALAMSELMNVDGGGPAAEKGGVTVAAAQKGEGGRVDRCQSTNGRRFFLPRFTRGRSSSAILPL